MKSCPKCRILYNDDAITFCVRCGQKVADDVLPLASDTEPAQEQEPAPERRHTHSCASVYTKDYLFNEINSNRLSTAFICVALISLIIAFIGLASMTYSVPIGITVFVSGLIFFISSIVFNVLFRVLGEIVYSLRIIRAPFEEENDDA